ncbi:MAG: scabin-related ADP-ribosyltransferase [Actinomycetota bacterium]
MTTLTWAALGGDPVPGEAGAFERVARSFSHTAETAASAHIRLNSFSGSVDAAVWSGEAAEAFRAKIGELPPQLAKLHESYAAAAEGVGSYGQALAGLKSEASGLLSRAQAAHQQLDTLPADQPAGDVQARLDRLLGEIDDLRGRRLSAERRALDRLQTAGEMGIRNDPWYNRAWSAVDRWVDDNADFLRSVSNVLKVVSAVAGLLSFIPVLAPICAPIALAAAGLALLTDAALAATGNGDWKMLAVDVALMVLPGAGKLVSGAIGSARTPARALRVFPENSVARSTDEAPLVFRGDQRTPEVIFKEGFQPRGTSDDLLEYATTNQPSAYVGTSRSSLVAQDFAGPGGYHYVVQKPGGIDVNATLGSRSPYPDELEVVFKGGIEPNHVSGVNRVLPDGTLGEFVPNPGFAP